jgi:hypothetical protein
MPTKWGHIRNRVRRIQGRRARRQMTRQIHRVVQEPHAVDGPYLNTAIQHEAAATLPSSSHEQATQARLDLVARRTVRKGGPAVERRECGNQRAPVHQGLPSPIVRRGPLDNSDEVAFGYFGEANSPVPCGQL